MNERIRELVKRAGGHFSTHNLMSNPVQHRESIELWDENIEKFAELIVRECMSITDKCSTGPGIYDLFADQIIAEHFGVEQLVK